MKFNRFILIILLVFVGAADFMLWRQATAPVAPPGDSVVIDLDTVWVYDTIYSEGPTIYVEKTVPVPSDVDTAAILQQHYTMRVLHDSVHLRDMATVFIIDTLFRNDIVGRQIRYDLATFDTHITLQPKKPRLSLSMGAQLGKEEAAVLGGVRYKRSEFLAGYDFRHRSPSLTFKYDIIQWP